MESGIVQRTATIERKTRETDVRLVLNLDGTGSAEIDTGIPFMDHMLVLMTAHGFLDLRVSARGDTQVDDHHTIEDIGICFGEALRQAIGNKEGLMVQGPGSNVKRRATGLLQSSKGGNIFKPL